MQSGFDADQVFAFLASVEAKSEHPIALAIVQAATEKQVSLLPVTEFRQSLQVQALKHK